MKNEAILYIVHEANITDKKREIKGDGSLGLCIKIYFFIETRLSPAIKNSIEKKPFEFLTTRIFQCNI